MVEKYSIRVGCLICYEIFNKERDVYNVYFLVESDQQFHIFIKNRCLAWNSESVININNLYTVYTLFSLKLGSITWNISYMKSREHLELWVKGRGGGLMKLK